MSRIVFLLEEYSMEVLLRGLMPRLFPGVPFLCVTHEGKQDLEKSLPRKLRGWSERNVRFCVIRDNDGADCTEVKRRLVELIPAARRSRCLVRIACQELEAWYFGEPAALARAYQRPTLAEIGAKAKYRRPDEIAKPSKELPLLVEEFQKVSGARAMGRELTRECTSPSFRALVSGLDRLVTEIASQEGTA